MNMHKSSLKFLFNFCLKRSIFTRNDYSVEIACRDELLTTSSGIAALFLLKQKQYFILLFLWASLRSKAHQDDFNTMIFRLLSVRRIRKEKITLKLQFIREKPIHMCNYSSQQHTQPAVSNDDSIGFAFSISAHAFIFLSMKEAFQVVTIWNY